MIAFLGSIIIVITLMLIVLNSLLNLDCSFIINWIIRLINLGREPRDPNNCQKWDLTLEMRWFRLFPSRAERMFCFPILSVLAGGICQSSNVPLSEDLKPSPERLLTFFNLCQNFTLRAKSFLVSHSIFLCKIGRVTLSYFAVNYIIFFWWSQGPFLLFGFVGYYLALL